MEIAELKNRTVAELQGYAEALKIPNCAGLRKQQLIFRIHEGLAARDETPVAEGVLDILPDGYGFLRSRSWSYLASPDDVYVSPAQISSLGLRRGDTLSGPVRPPRRGERYLALQAVQRINGFAPATARSRPHFKKLRPWYPDRRLALEVRGGETSMRIVDLIAPVGMGQRGLIVSPPKAGKTTILRHIARAVAASRPDVDLTVLLIDERPEEVTDMEENVPGRDHLVDVRRAGRRATRQVAEMVLEPRPSGSSSTRHDVVILLDSITQSRAGVQHRLVPHSGRRSSPVVSTRTRSHKPKRFFGVRAEHRGGRKRSRSSRRP